MREVTRASVAERHLGGGESQDRERRDEVEKRDRRRRRGQRVGQERAETLADELRATGSRGNGGGLGASLLLLALLVKML